VLFEFGLVVLAAAAAAATRVWPMRARRVRVPVSLPSSPVVTGFVGDAEGRI
jgi:hypothetical protein